MCTFYGICGDFSFLTHTQSRPDFLFRGNDFGEKEVSLLGCCCPLFTVQAPPQSNSTQQALKELGRMLDDISLLCSNLFPSSVVWDEKRREEWNGTERRNFTPTILPSFEDLINSLTTSLRWRWAEIVQGKRDGDVGSGGIPRSTFLFNHLLLVLNAFPDQRRWFLSSFHSLSLLLDRVRRFIVETVALLCEGVDISQWKEPLPGVEPFLPGLAQKCRNAKRANSARKTTPIHAHTKKRYACEAKPISG